MAFDSGRVSFCRFNVIGDAPSSVDEPALSILKEHAFVERDIGAPDEVEAGFITGLHLFDVQFQYEKNGFGDMLLFAIRLDTHQVPSAVKHAYKQMNVQALVAESPSGRVSKNEKRRAQETTDDQLRADLAAGKFRKSKIISLLWDLRGKQLYCGASTNNAVEQVSRLMRQAFSVDLELLSSGGIAGRWLRDAGKGRDYEDLKPSAFTAPPPEFSAADVEEEDAPVRREDRNLPIVPWTTKSTDMKDFLGNEFLLWLWRQVEAHEGLINIKPVDGVGSGNEIAVTLDRALDMDCAWDVRGKQSLRGHGPTRLPEAAEALLHGKWPRKVGMILADSAEGQQWELSLQADQWVISGANLPAFEEAQSAREIVEQRLQSIRRLSATLDQLLQTFMEQRIDTAWNNQRLAMRRWIKERMTREPEAVAAKA